MRSDTYAGLEPAQTTMAPRSGVSPALGALDEAGPASQANNAMGRVLAVTRPLDYVLRRCLEALRVRQGFMSVVAPAGSGKSSIARYLAAGLADAGHQVGFVPCSASFSNPEMLALLASALGMQPGPTRIDTLRALRRKLAARTDWHNRCILILDEAQNIASPETLGDLAYIRPQPPRYGMRHSDGDDPDLQARSRRLALPPMITPGPAAGMIYAFGNETFGRDLQRAFPAYVRQDAPCDIPLLDRQDVRDLVRDVLIAHRHDPLRLSPDAVDVLFDAAKEPDRAKDDEGCRVGPVVWLLDRFLPALSASDGFIDARALSTIIAGATDQTKPSTIARAAAPSSTSPKAAPQAKKRQGQRDGGTEVTQHTAAKPESDAASEKPAAASEPADDDAADDADTSSKAAGKKARPASRKKANRAKKKS